MFESTLSAIASAMDRARLPGMAIAVVNRQETLFAGGLGARRLGQPGPVDADTLFAVASNTKAFTASAIGLLVEEGKMAWDAPILDYLPDFQLYDPTVTRQITLRDALCHRAGLATWGGDWTWYGSIYSLEEVIRRARYQPPAYAFRTGYGYCNLMFMAAGLALEKVTGQPFGQFLKERFFTPLGMARTRTSTTELEGMDNVAAPHTLAQNGALEPVPYRNTDNNTAAGGVLSSVNEFAHWLRAQLNGGVWEGRQVIPAAVIEATRAPHNLVTRPAELRQLNPLMHLNAYGLGWQLSDYRGNLLVQHGGALDGMISMSAFLPEAGVGAVVLTNSDAHSLHTGALYTLLDAALDVRDIDWLDRYQSHYEKNETQKAAARQADAALPGGPASRPLAAYTGRFSNALYGDLIVALEDGALTLLPQAHPGVRGPLSHTRFDLFSAVWSDPVWGVSPVRFDLDDRGEVVSLRFRVAPDYLDPLEYVFTRAR